MVALDYAWPLAVDPSPAHGDHDGSFTRIWAPEHLIHMDDRGARLLGSTVAGPAGQALLDALNAPSPEPKPVTVSTKWERRTTRERYLEQVRRIQAHIQHGDIYELNYCVERTCTVPDLEPLALFAHLAERTRATHAAYFRWGAFHAVCMSPERFLRVDAGQLRTQPIKGTRPRHTDPITDERLRAELCSDPKDRAENIMAVDVARNDLGRVAVPGSVCVPELCTVRTFPNVHQLVSTVEARLRPDLSAWDAVRAAFPMASMTGAPKPRAMGIIRGMEDAPRGLYSGSLGFQLPDGTLDLNVVIRTITYDACTGRAALFTGGAITAQSDPEGEWAECEVKARSILDALTDAREGLFPDRAPLFVAVSGGIDSMVLLHVLHGMGHPCTVLHVDHGLRGADSEADATFVREQAARMGLPFRMQRVDVAGRSRTTAASVQMAARTERYAALEAMMADPSSACALAHHADDAVETLFIHLLRGTGLRGWAAIPVRSGRFVRPLLGVGRAAIRAYAERHAVPYREDPSNTDPHYLRNRIRHELLPLLEALRPGASRTLARSVAELRQLVALAGSAVPPVASATLPGDVRAWPVGPVLAAPAPSAELSRILAPYGPHPSVVQQVLDALVAGRIGSEFHLGAHSLVVDRGRLVMVQRGEAPSFPFALDMAEGSVGPLRWSIDEQGHHVPAGPQEAIVDLDALDGALLLRPWRRGDRMRPLGLGGSKRISDLLTEARVPRNLKPRCYVLCCGDRIVWLVGRRLAEGFQAGPDTARTVRFTFNGMEHGLP
jgi:para-aminobenzoate synthetase component 1